MPAKKDTLSMTFPIINAAGGGGPTWTTVTAPTTLTEGSPMSSITLSSFITGVGSISYNVTGLPSGLSVVSGVITGTPTTSTITTTTVNISATDSDGSASTSVIFPIIASNETVDFTTPASLPNATAGQNINETVVATGSQGSVPTYSFISVTNTGNASGIAGTQITVTGNQISGIAPRLFNAATYSFTFQASINAGAATNNQTFKILISQDNTCISPTNNICT